MNSQQPLTSSLPVVRSASDFQEALKNHSKFVIDLKNFKSSLIDGIQKEESEYSETVVNNIKHEPAVEFEVILPHVYEETSSFDVRSIEGSSTTSSSESGDEEELTNELKACSFCDKKFRNVRGHYRTKDCVLCQQKFECGTMKIKHLEEVHAATFQCNQCPHIANSTSSFLYHQRIHSNPESCGSCQQKFVLQHHLKVHKAKCKHGIDSAGPGQVLSCKECENPFSNDHLQGHQVKNYSEAKAQCDICGKFCHDNVCIRRHIGTHLTFECIFCKKFISKTLFSNHLSKHKSKVSVQCPICAKSFQKGNLKEHIGRIHLRENFFNCNLCSESFKLKISLEQHVKKKHLAKSLVELVECAISKKMKSENIFKSHKIKRTELFKCPQCGTKCSSRPTLKRHIKNIHVKVELFGCQICSKQYKSKFNLGKHLREQHHQI